MKVVTRYFVIFLKSTAEGFVKKNDKSKHPNKKSIVFILIFDTAIRIIDKLPSYLGKLIKYKFGKN